MSTAPLTGLSVAAVPSAHPPGPLPAGPVAPVTARLVLGGQTALYIPLKDGRYIRIPFRSQQQADDHRDLHMALLAPPSGHPGYPPGTVINMAAGTLECNGRTIEYFHKDPVKSKQLEELRQIFHSATGTTYSSTPWQFYLPGDRAPFNDIPPAFQQLNHGKLLKQIEFNIDDMDIADAGRTQAEKYKSYARHAIGSALLQDISRALDHEITAVSQLSTLESQSRATQLRKTKEHFEQNRTPCRKAMLRFAAYYPLTLTGGPGSKQTQLSAQKQTALIFLQTATGRVAGTFVNRKEDARLMDQLATEMALMSCTTPEDYEMGCLFFGVDKTQTSPELFLIGLAEKIRANNTQPAKPQTPANIPVGAPASDMSEIEDYIDQGMKLCFPHLNHPEDRAAMAQALLQIANDMIDGGPNGTRTNHLGNPWYPGIGLP